MRGVRQVAEPCRSGQPLDLAKCKKCRAKNKGVYDRLLVALKKVDKYFPDTVAGREAVRLVEELQMPSADKGVEKK